VVPVLPGGLVAWPVSARSAGGLAAQAGRLADWVAARPELDPADVGWSLAVTRSVLEHRAVVLGVGRQELIAGLAAVASGQPQAGVVTGAVPVGGAGRVGFVFSGQGSQRAGMGAGLYAASPVFAGVFDRVCGLLEAELGVPVRDVVLGAGDDARADQTVFAQAGLFAVQAGLVAVLAGCGITPDAVAGHSVGEVAAAWAAGVVSLEDACALVAARGRLMQALPAGGAMTAVAATEAEVTAAVEGVAGVSVAAVNGPQAVVISGDAAVVAAVAEGFAGRGVRVKPLRVSHAFHSHRMDPVLEELGRAAGGLQYAPPRIPWACGVSGELVTAADAGYWAAQAREPVRFADAVATLAAQGVSVFVEVGPDGTLSALGPAALDGAGAGAAVFVPVLRPGRPAAEAVAGALAGAYVRGAAVDWAAVLDAGEVVELPTYAFQHERYWPRPARGWAGDAAALGLGVVGHPLLGAAVELAAGGGLVFTGRLSLAAQPWLADHAVAGAVLVPGTALVELAVRAGDAAGCGRIGELTLEAPLAVPAEGAVQVQVLVGAADEPGQRTVAVFARAEGGGGDGAWRRYASGLLTAAGADAGQAGAGDFAVWPPPGAVPVPVEGFYAGLAAAGYGYGPAFRGLRAAWRRGADVFAEVALPEEVAGDAGAFGLHPALLDAALHAAGLAGGAGRAADAGAARMPFAWGGVSLYAAGAAALRARVRQDTDGTLSLVAADAVGAPVVSVESLVLRPVSAGQLAGDTRGGPADALFSLEWVPVPVPQQHDLVADRWAAIGPGVLGLTAADPGMRAYPDLAALAEAVAAGEPVPEVVLACAGAAGQEGGGGEARLVAGRVLGLVQDWLAGERLEAARLVVVTRGAVAAWPGEDVADLPGAAARGLIRSAQAENPGRIILADLPLAVTAEDMAVLAAAAGSGEPELAIRGAAAYGRRLARPAGGLVPPPGGGPWRLAAGPGGTLDDLVLVGCPQAAGPLGAGRVRVAVRAAGVNFRDVLIALDMYPDAVLLGGEIAGVVLEAGPGVTGLAAGDRVLGLAEGGFGPVAVTDARLLARMPEGWSFARAAAVPVAFVTAWHALADLAGARAGQRLLVHAAAGGAGTAAVAIARHLGLEVYATASPGKHGVLAAMGLDEAHIASSRDTGFAEKFLASTGGAGVDIVLNSLSGELTDASLRLLPRGGQFLELGRTGIRDATTVARDYPGVAYRLSELAWAGAARLGQILAQVVGLLAAGELAGSPVRAWDVRRAGEALRFMSQARHTGKIVLTIPPDPAAAREAGTVLVTGGTGTLGALVAGHLAAAAGQRACHNRPRPAPAGREGDRDAQLTRHQRVGQGAELGLVEEACPLALAVRVGAPSDDGRLPLVHIGERRPEPDGHRVERPHEVAARWLHGSGPDDAHRDDRDIAAEG